MDEWSRPLNTIGGAQGRLINHVWWSRLVFSLLAQRLQSSCPLTLPSLPMRQETPTKNNNSLWSKRIHIPLGATRTTDHRASCLMSSRTTCWRLRWAANHQCNIWEDVAVETKPLRNSSFRLFSRSFYCIIVHTIHAPRRRQDANHVKTAREA